MTENDNQLMAMLAKSLIREAIVRLARGEDRRDATLISSAYWPDSITDYGVFSGNFDQYLDWVVPGSPALPVTQHVLGQSYITLDEGHALAETHVLSYHRVDTGSEHLDSTIGGRYLDTFECRDGDWRIRQRTMVYDWSQDLGPSIDWSQGLMGQPLSDDRYIGAAAADFSRSFFGERS